MYKEIILFLSEFEDCIRCNFLNKIFMIASEYISLNTLLEVKNYDGYNNQGKNVMVEPTKPYQESSSIHNSSLPLRQLSTNQSSFPISCVRKRKVSAKEMAHQ